MKGIYERCIGRGCLPYGWDVKVGDRVGLGHETGLQLGSIVPDTAGSELHSPM